ncbi:MAG: c-type cytochrome [Actinomycetota bacterium]
MRRLASLGVATFLLAACSSTATQDSLQPAGPNAQSIHDLFIPVFWIAAIIFVIVEVALVAFTIRFRHRPGRDTIPPQIHGNPRLEIAWTILPALILAGVAVPTVATIFDLKRDPGPDALQVNVLAHQFWWEFDYPGEGVITANELHIPVDTTVLLTLCGAGNGYGGIPVPSPCQPGGAEGPQPAGVGNDVIHSFWVPQLAGTQDAVPGRANTLLIEASETGTFSGQCKEFCGLSHAYMRFRVVVHSQADYDRWLAGQRMAAVSPVDGSLAATGAQLFLNGQCIACHAIDGLETADGRPLVANGGPNLTHFASRDCFAGCILDMTEANVKAWLDNPPAIKAGSWMPDYGLTQQEIDALTAYMLSLE